MFSKEDILKVIEEFKTLDKQYYLFGVKSSIEEIKEFIPEHIECVVVPDDYFEDKNMFFLAPTKSLNSVKIARWDI